MTIRDFTHLRKYCDVCKEQRHVDTFFSIFLWFLEDFSRNENCFVCETVRITEAKKMLIPIPSAWEEAILTKKEQRVPIQYMDGIIRLSTDPDARCAILQYEIDLIEPDLCHRVKTAGLLDMPINARLDGLYKPNSRCNFQIHPTFYANDEIVFDIIFTNEVTRFNPGSYELVFRYISERSLPPSEGENEGSREITMEVSIE